ncbi:MAG TPA: S1/P1 nuclease [Chitinophagaceae bacterium]|nr:S1/P1 nuclease [Chitinophagaceae bacterium]
MKKPIVSFFAVVLIFFCVSWGVTGHKTVADIAFNHLTPKAKSAVAELLGTQSMADVASWADEVRSTPEYKSTGPEHYINVPAGLTQDEFTEQVMKMPDDNAYKALESYVDVLYDTKSTKTQKTTALKFIIHIVGDMHQPMHVSRAEDKGGNTIQVRYDGKGTNLHALWDSKLLEHGGLTDVQLSEQYDHITPAQVTAWQKTPVMDWAWESYQISAQLYAGVEKSNGNIDDAYYTKYMPVIRQRLMQAGIRLAGLLNEVFKNGLQTSAAEVKVIPAAPAGDSYCDVVYGGKYFDNSGMTLLNLGGAYPNNTMTVVIYKKDRGNWNEDPIKLYDGKKICVTGKQITYQGRPEIVVEQPNQIVIQ